MTTDLLHRPEPPIGQRLIAKTPIIEVWNGSEQRAANMTHPRWRLEYAIELPTEEDARKLEMLLDLRLGDTWRAPVWFERFELSAAAAAAQDTVLGDFASADMAAGDQVYIEHPDGETSEFLEIGNFDTTNLVFTTNLVNTYPAGSELFLALTFFMGDEQGVERLKVDGTTLTVTLDVERHRSPGGVGQGVVVAGYRGLPVLDRMPIGEQFVDLRSWGGKRIDFGGRVQRIRSFDRIKKASARRFFLDDRDELQWFKAFYGQLYGMRDPFWAPTWRPDFKVTTQPNGTEFIGVADDPAGLLSDWFAAEQNPHVQLLMDDESVKYRRVHALTGPVAGEMSVEFDFPISGTIDTLSYLQLCRLGRDEVYIEHEPLQAYADLVVKTIDELNDAAFANGVMIAEVAARTAALNGVLGPSGELAASAAARVALFDGYLGVRGTVDASVAARVAEFNGEHITIPNENGYYLPETEAESADLFTLKGISGQLDHIWLMQAAGTPIEDEQTSATDYDLASGGAGAGGLAYQQNRAGWSRYFVHWSTDLVAYFDMGSGNPFDTTTTSQVSMLLGEYGATNAGTKNILVYGSSGAANISILGNGRLRLNINATVYDSTLLYESDGVVHLLALEFDLRGGAEDARFRTDDETVEAAWDAGVGNSTNKRLGGATITGEFWFGYLGLAIGANAEALIDANPITVFTV